MRPVYFLLILTYIAYLISFFLPAYTLSLSIYSNTTTNIMKGWECAITSFAFVFDKKFILIIIAVLPNLFMILSFFIYKKLGLALLVFILMYNLISCSTWCFLGLFNGRISDLLVGYWLWCLSIVANSFILVLIKRIQY